MSAVLDDPAVRVAVAAAAVRPARAAAVERDHPELRASRHRGCGLCGREVVGDVEVCDGCAPLRRLAAQLAVELDVLPAIVERLLVVAVVCDLTRDEVAVVLDRLDLLAAFEVGVLEWKLGGRYGRVAARPWGHVTREVLDQAEQTLGLLIPTTEVSL